MSSDNQNLEYKLPQNAYANFDAVSLKDFIIQRLNENAKFTDQNYEGSNLAAFIDIVAYYTHVLLFYVNQTSSESLFTQASIYENMNRIVSLISYKPTGKQTSLVPISCVADASLAPNNYLLRKYSYFNIDNIQYTIIDDFSFEKTTNDQETISSIEENVILYQGTVQEYPLYTAEGTDYETFPIVVDNLVDLNDPRFISNGTISVYVKELDSGTWKAYDQADSLFLTSTNSRIYDVRLNENGHFELKFGNGTFGRKLKEGDIVAVYYILSDGDRGIISKNAINGNKLFNFNSSQFNEIYQDVNEDTTSSLIDLTNNTLLTFSNPANSTVVSEAETVEQIKQNAPFLISSQLRLVTSKDYETFLNKSIPNILNSVKVVDNESYISQYIDYFYRICIDPNKVNRVILNQVNFADSCDFNNINIFCVPTFEINIDESYPSFLSNSFKNLIKDLTLDKKMVNHEIVPRDPIYMAYDLGYTVNTVSKNISKDTSIVIVRENNNKISKEILKKQVKEQIIAFFDSSTNKLGQKLDISQLTTNILSLNGIKSIRTQNNVENSTFNGISFVSWNPAFENVDEELVNQTTTLPFFKFPYFYRPNTLINKITVIDE